MQDYINIFRARFFVSALSRWITKWPFVGVESRRGDNECVALHLPQLLSANLGLIFGKHDCSLLHQSKNFFSFHSAQWFCFWICDVKDSIVIFSHCFDSKSRIQMSVLAWSFLSSVVPRHLWGMWRKWRERWRAVFCLVVVLLQHSFNQSALGC